MGSERQGQHGVADLLELFHDFVVDAGVVVVRPAQHHDADAVFRFQPLQDFPALGAHDLVLEIMLGLQARLHGAGVLLPGEAENIHKLIVHLLGQQRRVAGIHKGIEEKDVVLLENIPFLGERGLDGFRRGGHRGAGAMRLRVLHVARQVVNHGAEDDVERLLLVVHIEHVVHVRNAHLGGEAGVDGAALGAFLVKLLVGVVGVNQVLGGNPQRLKVGAENGIHRVHVQDARNADAQAGALLHQFHALLLLRRQARTWAAGRPPPWARRT